MFKRRSVYIRIYGIGVIKIFYIFLNDTVLIVSNNKTVFSVFTIRPVENRMTSFDIGNKTRKISITAHRENCPHGKRKTHQPEMNSS